MESGGSRRSRRIEPRRALVLVACLALFATWAAPATAGGPTPDPAPKKSRGPAPDPAPQAKPAPTRTVTPAASTSTPTASASISRQLPAPVVPSTAKAAVTANGHQASTAAPVTHRPVARDVSTTPPPPSVLRRAGRALGALTFGRLAGDVGAVDVPSAASSPDQGLLMLGGAILLLIVLGEVGFLSASVRLLRRAI